MAAPPTPRVSDRVHRRLRADILEGRLAPGDGVPSERVLAEELGVNRQAVREALKRLEQAGLVRIVHGGATRVLDWREAAGLEVLLDLLGGDDGDDAPPPELARSVLEMRESIGVDAAARCAVRAPEGERSAVRALAARTADAIGVDDAAVDDGYAALWRAVVAGSGNVAYRLALNSLVAALDAYGDMAAAARPADPARVRALGDAVGAGDPEAAAAAARALLGSDTLALG